MEQRTEVIEYLRNIQKASEIESQMNGVNIWVLLGAIAVIGWALLNSPPTRILTDSTLFVRVLVATGALWTLISTGTTSAGGDELRFSPMMHSEHRSPLFTLALSAAVALPAIYLIYPLSAAGVGAYVLVLMYGLFGILLSLWAMLRPLAPTKKKKGRFGRLPDPNFANSRRTDRVLGLILVLALCYGIYEQGAQLFALKPQLTIDEVRNATLIASLYILCLIALRRKVANDSTAWTYEIETDLVLNNITAEDAVRIIERRRFGQKFWDVLDQYMRELDSKFDNLTGMLQDSAAKLDDVANIPPQYQVERKAKANEVMAEVKLHLEDITQDCDNLKDYLEALEMKALPGLPLSSEKTRLRHLKERERSYSARASSAEREIDKLLDRVQRQH